jgi:hypothetical protein
LRDTEEDAAITAVLEQLPADHPARLACLDHTDTIALTHLVADRPELVGGELLLRPQSASETSHDNAAAKHGDQG